LKILVACFPKSGSTYLSALIGNLPGFSPVLYTPAGGRREQELSEVEMERACSVTRHVAQLHVRASDYTLELIEKFDVTPIVLVRNIYDAAVSLADHLANESTVMPMAYFDRATAQRPFQDRLNAVFDLAAPWYFNFYVSWQRARPEAIVTYENLILGGPERQNEYFNAIGLDTNIDDVGSSIRQIQSLDTRFNVGKAGRGAEAITLRHRGRIEQLASYYPDIDFSHIGIGRKIYKEITESRWESLKARASHLVRRYSVGLEADRGHLHNPR
jgi:hypothetical protein